MVDQINRTAGVLTRSACMQPTALLGSNIVLCLAGSCSAAACFRHVEANMPHLTPLSCSAICVGIVRASPDSVCSFEGVWRAPTCGCSTYVADSDASPALQRDD